MPLELNNSAETVLRFLEHALKDLDYEVREKTFLESALGRTFGPY